MVRTRFAPSPTGYLHIGGVRTALFCWLFVRRHGGQFILRIDDTDEQRNVETALAPILRGLSWLGIDWDEGPGVGGPHAPYFQSARTHRYRAAVEQLLASGHAYRDYARTEEIQKEREEAERTKTMFIYSRRWMATTAEDRARFEAEGRAAVVRLKMPREGRLIIPDLVRGDVEFAWPQEQDHVIQRADGSFIYHLASVVDDHDFEITHVIRAEEHLSNTPRQIFIAQSLGYALPAYAHLPYVAEPGSKQKLSKRKLDKYLKNKDFAEVYEQGRAIAAALGREVAPETFNPVIVDFYEQVGYLPDAIINYLVLLGWSLDDKTEFFTRAQMIESFTLDRIGKGPASFDPKKLAAFQLHYMQALSTDEKVERVMPFLEAAKLVSGPGERARVRRIVEVVGARLKVAGDILGYGMFFHDEVTFDEAAFTKRLRKPGAAELTERFGAALATVDAFEPPELEKAMTAFLAAEGVALGEVIHAVRVAVTGTAAGPGFYECLAVLGKDACRARITKAVERVRAPV